MPEPLPPPSDDPTASPPATVGHGAVESYRVRGAWVIVAFGDLDADTTLSLQEALDAAAATAPVVVLDARHVTFGDSAFVNLLARAHQTGYFRVVGIQRSVLRILHITGLDEILHLHDTVDAALDAL